MEPLYGILNVDKPAGLTSARVVGRVKRLLPRGTKIGHAGTLDPFATGVLLLLVGKATKQCEAMMGQPKQYIATIRFGATTATDDLDSPAEPFANAVLPTEQAVRTGLTKFVGLISQRPPAYSALWVGGRRAYDLAREGQAPVLAERTVRVDAIELVAFTPQHVDVRIDCGRGTYIRSIARDLGELLQCGGYLTALRRTRIGDYDIDHSTTVERLAAEGVAAHLLAPALLAESLKVDPARRR